MVVPNGRPTLVKSIQVEQQLLLFWVTNLGIVLKVIGMNERIKELEAKCWDYARGIVNTQKFAELIIQECISTIENAENGYQDYRNQIEDGMRNHCISLIKNKFGVEE